MGECLSSGRPFVREVVGRDRALLPMFGNEIRNRVPDDEVRHAGLFAEARLGEIGDDEVSVNWTGLRCICLLVDDEGREEGFSGHGGFLSGVGLGTRPRSPTHRRVVEDELSPGMAGAVGELGEVHAIAEIAIRIARVAANFVAYDDLRHDVAVMARY